MIYNGGKSTRFSAGIWNDLEWRFGRTIHKTIGIFASKISQYLSYSGHEIILGKLDIKRVVHIEDGEDNKCVDGWVDWGSVGGN